MSENKQPTIYDVSERAGVSLATVSRVVNNNGKVKEETKRKVLKAIKELNYRPNAMAKGLASSKTTMVGMMVPDLTDLYFAELAQGIDAVAKIYDYSVSLSVSDNNPTAGKEAFETLMSQHVDGIVYIGNKTSQEMFDLLKSSPVPVVFAGSVAQDGKLPSVNIDYVQAFQQAGDILKQHLSDTQIALVDNPGESGLSALRQQGFLKAVSKGKIYESEDDYRSGYNLAHHLLEDGIKGVIVGEDEPAIGILNYMLDNHVKVPADFQIISSNDTKLVKMTRPAISSVTQPEFDIGAVSMRLLTKLMSGDPVDDPTVILPHEFVLKDTTL
ncbi:LacI family DNA-binding transcriptional regulator [Oenococcus kitaharae]|uniref:Catabolite control protein A n=1 Tax=Oenococcus kitaharae DSM 17330 TaxID=1045004 RepID=G9WGI8_9LACO|nr:LacI family DNA-binding transcriptional regulator [Oenococcus kitaharae]EHN59815.1 Catabolite control protein A [Oenococcus kitaharae DSM 17330]OEY83631.1 LacI family transcriptional regulator [Oenococcus kitaharae]OEY85429.1 LacI family transcriptional regulator [Oenococcus kitaharae]OEY86282.1 LacI family transcriptional regulator [Oenococcus kitaharae]